MVVFSKRNWKILTTVFLLAALAESVLLCAIAAENRNEREAMRILLRHTSAPAEETTLSGIFTETEQDCIAARYWSYELYINDTKVLPAETFVFPRNEPLRITFVQIERPRKLPQDLHLRGALGHGDPSDSFESHLVIQTALHFETIRKCFYEQDAVSGEMLGKTTISYVFPVRNEAGCIEILPDFVLTSYDSGFHPVTLMPEIR